MPKNALDQPTPEQLHGFITGDPIAIDEVVCLLLPQLYRWAIGKYRNLPEDEIQSVVNQVFAETCNNHKRYSPAASKLTTYLIGLIKFRLADLYHDIIEKDKALDFDPDTYENLLQVPYNDTSSLDANTRLARESFFQDASILLDNCERDFLEALKKGEKHLEIFTTILTRYDRLTAKPSHEVKNTKERLFRKLKIIADDQGYSLQDLLNG